MRCGFRDLGRDAARESAVRSERLAYIVVTAGLRRVAAPEASVRLLVERALNPVWTWWLLRKRPTTWALAEGAVLVGATAVQALRACPKVAEVPA